MQSPVDEFGKLAYEDANNINPTAQKNGLAGLAETNRFTMNGVDYVGDNATGQYIAPQGASILET